MSIDPNDLVSAERLVQLMRQETARSNARFSASSGTLPLATSWSAYVQSDVLQAQMRLNEQLLAYIDQLTERVASLEAAHAASQLKPAATEKTASVARRQPVEAAGTGRAVGENDTLDRSPTTRMASGDEAFAAAFDFISFAERFRGRREVILERQAIYVDEFRGRHTVLDLACGRGEFLELMGRYGINTRGIDTNPRMIDTCQQRGFDAILDDAFTYLTSLSDESVDGIFAAQFVEHLAPQLIMELIALSQRKLTPGGVMVVETVNPHCPATFATFYLDPTHVKPVPAPLLAYMTEQSGLKVQALRFSSRFDTQESSPLDVSSAGLPDEVTHYLDYAVIARRQ
jgi:2-polyprenyl-3-methyl-5-hydroxy-6-metoxy-1,4-benzoquinol methylase